MIIAQTRRLVLRHFHDGDAPAMQRVLGDAEVMRFSMGVMSPPAVRAWLRRRQDDYQQRGYGLWAVVEKLSGQTIGYCGLTRFPDINGRPESEVGYRLARAHWGRGLATESATAVRDYAFDTLSLPRLISLIDPQNTASIRVAEKLGMHYERDVMLDGYTHPDGVYAIVRHPQAASCASG